MFNYVKKRLYEEYSVNRCNDRIEFLKKEKVVATLYLKEQVLNIFLYASSNVFGNEEYFATFVIAKKYPVLNNGRIRKTEVVWLIGYWGAAIEYNPMNPGISKLFKPENVSTLSICYRCLTPNIRFELFELEIEWEETEQSYSHPQFLNSHPQYRNPALIYPTKHGVKKVHNRKKYLRKCYNWECGDGLNAAGSSEIREFIDTLANKVNHTEWSKISYHRAFRKSN